MADINTNLFPGPPTLEQRMSIATPASNMNRTVQSFGDYLANQYQQRQALQQNIALEVAKARADAWAKQQDPIARALTMGKLGEMGFPISNIGGMQGPNIDDMLRGNPYAQYVGGMGSPNSYSQSSPQPMQNQTQAPAVDIKSAPPMAASFNPFNPIANGNLVQEKVKMSPFGTALPGEFTNLDAVQATEKAKQAVQPESADAASAITYANVMADNIKTIKSIVDKKDFDWGLFGAAKASFGDPSLVSFLQRDAKGGDLLKITNALNEIKRSAFGEGGKNLTNTEKDIIYRTINPRGQSKEEWLKLLNDSQNILATKAKLLSKKPDQLSLNGSEPQPEAPQANAQAPSPQDMMSYYKSKYPGRSDQEIMNAMKKQGLI